MKTFIVVAVLIVGFLLLGKVLSFVFKLVILGIGVAVVVYYLKDKNNSKKVDQ